MDNHDAGAAADEDAKGALKEEDVARDLSISVRTVQGWRSDGRGPPFLKVTSRIVRYPRELYEAWKESVTKRPK
jgi:predicted DNA-binding transcriptional regulator AlpA